MNDQISRKAAIDALGERPMVWTNDDEYALGERNQYDIDRLAIETVPSVHPEPCEDAVSRKWLIEAVEEGWIKFDTEKDYNRYIHLVRDIAPSVTLKQRWIPCSLRLPDREMPVWVSMCDDDVLKAIWRNGWCEPNGYKVGLTDGQVIAWMPRQTMPESYREGGKKDG